MKPCNDKLGLLARTPVSWQWPWTWTFRRDILEAWKIRVNSLHDCSRKIFWQFCFAPQPWTKKSGWAIDLFSINTAISWARNRGNIYTMILSFSLNAIFENWRGPLPLPHVLGAISLVCITRLLSTWPQSIYRDRWQLGNISLSSGGNL